MRLNAPGSTRVQCYEIRIVDRRPQGFSRCVLAPQRPRSSSVCPIGDSQCLVLNAIDKTQTNRAAVVVIRSLRNFSFSSLIGKPALLLLAAEESGNEALFAAAAASDIRVICFLGKPFREAQGGRRRFAALLR